MTDPATKSCPACFSNIDVRASRCPSCAQRQPDAVGLHRDVPGRALGGVTAALAHHFNWDLTLMRIALIASVAIAGPVTLWVYAALWLMLPYEAAGKAPLARLFDGLSNLFSPKPQQGVERVG